LTVDILVTGASGRTGQAIVRAMARGGHAVRFLTRQTEYVGDLRDVAGAQAVTGDLANDSDVRSAVYGVDVVYHIPPNMNPGEIPFGTRIAAAARAAGVKHFVYHSVLHPQIEALPHHWNKVFVEQAVIKSGVPFTILQPSSYMQNTLPDWPAISREGVHTLGFSVKARLSLVDLDDVAEAATKVIGRPEHAAAIYELAGPEMLSGEDKARVLTQVLGRPVRAVQQSPEAFRGKAAAAGMAQHVIDTRLAMFAHYGHQGLAGNANVLEMLLGRPAATFDQFARRTADAQNG
jgi:uncharacterized protein YbjT (DUF2867 family)